MRKKMMSLFVVALLFPMTGMAKAKASEVYQFKTPLYGAAKTNTHLTMDSCAKICIHSWQEVPTWWNTGIGQRSIMDRKPIGVVRNLISIRCR